MSSKKSPNSSPSFGRSDVPEPKLVGSSKSKPLSDMNRVEVENYIVGLERVVDIYKGTDRTVAKGNLDKVRQYYLDRFEEEDEELTSAPSGESSDDVFVDLEDIDFELDAGGDIFGNSTLSTSPSAPENTLDYDEIVDYKGESKRIRDLDEDVIYTLEDLEKNRAEMEEDQYDFLRQLIMSGQMLTQKPDEQDPLKMQAKMDAARQQDEKNKKEHCLSFFMRPDEDPRSLKRKITAFQEILTEGEVGDIGPFDLLKKEGKIWIVFKNEGMGIELEESHVVLWIKLMNSVGSMGALRTVEEVRSAGGESILSKIKNLPKTKSDEILVKGSASEVSRHITQEIETSGDLVLQKEIKAMDDYQDRLDETKEAVEKGGFQIPHLDAFVDLGGKIGEEDRFGMRPVEYEGKFNFIDRNNMSVYASNFDDWFDEIGAFKLQTLNTGLNLKSVTALVKHQGEFKFLESDGTLYKLDEQKILIEDASVFDEVGLEDQYGLRCVKWNGLYNFVDSKNRILSSEKWFSEVSPFRSVAIPRLAESESKMPISLVKVDGEMHFFIPSG
ncbi:hypothetical protein KAR91_18275, partial [Candidatus Pacearchaeota archaeon]|nr:hypothetical protein [Candidatus Pacearchaeota archaeon]